MNGDGGYPDIPHQLRGLVGQNRGNGANDNGGRVSAPIIMDNALRQSEENHISIPPLLCPFSRAQRLAAIRGKSLRINLLI